MLGEPAVPRMDCEDVVGVPGWDNAWDGLGGVLCGRLMPMENAVLLWDGGALAGGGGAPAAAAAGDGMTTCALAGEAEACTLPWEGEPEGTEVPTPSPSCLPGGVGDAVAEGVSFLTEGGAGEAGDSVSAGLFWPMLPPPLPDPEGLPVEEEELEALSLLLEIPDMRSLDGTCPEGGGRGVDQTTQVRHTHCKR